MVDTIPRQSYSQFGEDLTIEAIFRTHKRLDAGFYVDVGAFHPVHYSNTALLHHVHGWSGLNIDANADAISSFDFHRPTDVNVCSLVGRPDEVRQFVYFDHPGVNTADETMLARQLSPGSPFTEMRREDLTARDLPSLLDQHFGDKPIGLLNVDVEGMDVEVLRFHDWTRWRPFLISVEAHGLDLDNPSSSELIRLLRDQDYKLVSHIFVTSLFLNMGPRIPD
jgi:hypothetical protein